MQLKPENTQVETEYQYSSQQKSQIPSIDGGYILSDLESQEQEQLKSQFLLNDAAESNSSERSDLEEDYIANVVDGNDYNSSSLTNNPFFDFFPTIAKICSPSPANTTAIAPPSPPTRPQRMRKSTAKQASQNRRDEEARLQKEAKRKKKPILEDISQLMDLPFRSSQ
jgi:hypothetical protein